MGNFKIREFGEAGASDNAEHVVSFVIAYCRLYPERFDSPRFLSRQTVFYSIAILL
jgi:hypothetical protein